MRKHGRMVLITVKLRFFIAGALVETEPDCNNYCFLREMAVEV